MPEEGLLCRSRRGPAALDTVVRPLNGPWHGASFTDGWRLGLARAGRWGRRPVAHLGRPLEVEPHRTRCTKVFLVERWAPEAACRHQAQELLRARRPAPGAPSDVLLDDSQPAKRGQAMDAVAPMTEPTRDASIRGHQDVGGLLLFRGPVIPVGIRRSVTTAQGAAVALPSRTTTAWAAPLIQACHAPAGVPGRVLLAADALG